MLEAIQQIKGWGQYHMATALRHEQADFAVIYRQQWYNAGAAYPRFPEREKARPRTLWVF